MLSASSVTDAKYCSVVVVVVVVVVAVVVVVVALVVVIGAAVSLPPIFTAFMTNFPCYRST